MKHSQKNLKKKIAVFGCKHTTLDFIRGLVREGFIIDHLITISPDKGLQQNVAGYIDLRPAMEEMDIPVLTVSNYNLQSAQDKANLKTLGLDLAFVIGWQRLLPEWLLNSLSIGAFGMHGSFRPLPHGRGRSPMNWSLLKGKDKFITHLFQYLPGVDDGPIAGVQEFQLTQYDTCLTAHHKNMISMRKLACKVLPGLMDGTLKLTPQDSDVEASYWPKRIPEDGLILWEDDTEDIYNLIRAVTKPFPGAFSFLDDDTQKKIIIWRTIPFDRNISYPDANLGEILEVFYDGTFVVKTGNSTLLVQEVEGHQFTHEDIGRVFGPADMERRVFENLPE